MLIPRYALIFGLIRRSCLLPFPSLLIGRHLAIYHYRGCRARDFLFRVYLYYYSCFACCYLACLNLATPVAPYPSLNPWVLHPGWL